MSDVIRKDLGAVSAYAMAVAAGYPGTEAEFIEEQLGFAENARSVAEAKEATLNALEAAEQAKSDAETSAQEAKTAEEGAVSARDAAQTARSEAEQFASEAEAQAEIVAAVEKDFSNISNAFKGSASGAVISLDDVSSLEHMLAVKARSKNLYNENNFIRIGNGAYGWNIIGDFPWRLTLLDKDTSVDISGLNIGIAIYAENNDITGYSWFVAEGEIRLTSKDSFVENPYAKRHLRCDSLFVYPNTQECIDKLNRRFAIMVTAGDEIPTEYVPYVDVEQTKVLAMGKNLLDVNSGNYAPSTATLGVETAEGEVKITTDADRASTWIQVKFCIGEMRWFLGKTLTFSAKYEHSTGTLDPVLAMMGTNTLISGTETLTDQVDGTSLEGKHIQATFENGNYTAVAYIDPTTMESLKYLTVSLYIQNGGASAEGDWAKWSDIQVEYGDIATDYEPYTENKYSVETDGTVANLKSISPNMTITSDTANVVLDAQYNKDINKVIEKLVNRIAALEAAAL